VVLLVHVLRNSMIPVVTVIALGIPADLRRRHHHRADLQGERARPASDHRDLQANDLPMVQTLAFIFAVLIVLFNLIADVLYGLLDPRIRYD
jgi:peptide/nickel transport system permease protein